MSKELAKAAMIEMLEIEGYFADEKINELDMNMDDVLSVVYGFKVVSAKRGLIVGYDYDAESYYLSAIVGSVKKGFEFEYESEWFEEKDEALKALEIAK